MEADLNENTPLRSSDNLLTGDIILIYGYIFFARQLLFAIKTKEVKITRDRTLAIRVETRS